MSVVSGARARSQSGELDTSARPKDMQTFPLGRRGLADVEGDELESPWTFTRGNQRGSDLDRIGGADLMAFHDALRQLPDALDGGDLEPPRPELQDIPLGLDDSGRGIRPGAAASGQCGEQFDARQGPYRDVGIATQPADHARRSRLEQDQRDEGGGVPESHQPLSRSSNRSFSTLPRTRIGRRLPNHRGSPPYRAAASLDARARGDAPRGPTFCRRWRSERGARSADRDRAR